MNTEQKTVKVTITAADTLTGEKSGDSKSGVYTSLEYVDKKYNELVSNITLPEGKAWSYEYEWQ